MSLLRNLAATGAAAAASAALGGLATTPEAAWYRRLDKPRWQPPPLAFPLVWTPLYIDIATTSALALTRLEQAGRDGDAATLRRAIAVNLALNTGWSVLFWRVRKPWLSTAWCALLAGHGARQLGRLREVDPALAAAWAPYPAWCTFATLLNASIARRNA